MTTAGDMRCADVLEKLDIWMDRKLPPDDASSIASHLETCVNCSATVAARTALRDRLRSLARSVETPAYLSSRIGAKIDGADVQTRHRWSYLAAAAAVLLTVGAYSAWQSGHLRLTQESRENYITSIAPGVAPVMRVGLSQHVHCAVFRSYPAQPSAADQFAAGLGPQYAGLIPVVRRHIPAEFHVEIAHHCDYHGRQYIHVIARHRGSLISLLITRRTQGEAFENDLRAVAAEAGESVYSSATPRFSIAGFQTPQYLVYLVSDLNQTANLAVIEAMTPQLKNVLI